MFAKFNLNLDEGILDHNNDYDSIGAKMYANQMYVIQENLDKYLSPTGVLDATAIEKDWFPGIPAQVFLSHSHQDEHLVIRFAGYLYRHYGIKSFIDSTVWGYANDLLKLLDNKYCVQREKTNGGYIYDYDKRNQSTAHVHLILQGALAKMIDQCECLMFVNTPNSLSAQDIGNDSLTSSPWIYSELLMANTFPVRNPSYHGIYKRERIDSYFEHSELNVGYEINLTGFQEIGLGDIQLAEERAAIKNARAILNQLYLDKGVLK